MFKRIITNCKDTKRKRKKTSKTKVIAKESQVVPVATEMTSDISLEDQQDIEKLIAEKRQELSGKQTAENENLTGN